jgi:zinc transporter ZupT
LSELYPDYPLSNTIAVAGIFILLLFQQLSMIYGSQQTTKQATESVVEVINRVDSSSCLTSEAYKVHCDHETKPHDIELVHQTNSDAIQTSPTAIPDPVPVPSPPNPSEKTVDNQIAHSSHCDGHDHALAVHVVLQAHSMRDLVNAYALEISTAVHSFIIGFDLGIMDSNDAQGISILFVALVFHQLVEGIGMGSILQSSRDLLSTWKMVTFITIFSITISCGVVIGLCVNSDENVEIQEGVQGSATSLAAGAMIFVSLSELVGNYFNKKEWEERTWLKIWMICGFGAGLAMMAIIGIWA